MDNYYNYMNLESYMSKLGLEYDATYMRWVKDIIDVKLSMFSYDNVSEYELSSDIMERALMFNNFLCGYNDSALGFGIYRWRADSIFNRYWRPETVSLLTLSGKTVKDNVPYKDIVLFRDNRLDLIPFLTLNAWINKIIEKEKTLDNIFTWLSFPMLIVGDKEHKTELKNIAKKALNREPFILASKGFKDHVESFPIQLPVELEDVYNILKKYRGMALASMGIYEVDEKRERIVTSEIEAQNDYVDMVYTDMYNERKRFVEECNKRFGTNIVLKESYVENQNDSIRIQKRRAMAEKAPDIEIAQIKADGEVEAAKQGGQTKSAKQGGQTGGANNA